MAALHGISITYTLVLEQNYPLWYNLSPCFSNPKQTVTPSAKLWLVDIPLPVHLRKSASAVITVFKRKLLKQPKSSFMKNTAQRLVRQIPSPESRVGMGSFLLWHSARP
ncbi:hypothetical protein KIL84_002850 [Mauremys mutica]|uniref:Uncharacterized protein n=1 Tax=Mauremys mutica TaxID=74926 RepID=A0A9D4AMK6_9SAUR|nr:hypothetical protein KIL84_002850 [Mauremys mutica]